MRMRDIKVGQWVRVMYDHSGARDGVVVEKDHRTDPKPRVMRVYFPGDSVLDSSVEMDQIVSTGDVLTADHSGIKPFAGYQLAAMRAKA